MLSLDDRNQRVRLSYEDSYLLIAHLDSRTRSIT